MDTGARTPGWESAALDDLEALAGRLGCRAARDEPLARHTSMGVGGPCPMMVWPARPAHVVALADWMGRRDLGWRVIGGGSNLLVRDTGVAEVVLNSCEMIDGERYGTSSGRYAAGTPTAGALRRSVGRGLDGLVWAAGLPGTIAGAAAGNAGCWGSDMASSVLSLELIDARGCPHDVPAHRLRWAYRSLDLPDTIPTPFVILGVTIRLASDDPDALEQRYLDLQRRKRSQQPVGARNSGCVFRNPPGERSAGALIDAAGCKGLAIGDVEVSPVHANFLINRGNGRCEEVMALVGEVRSRVRSSFGVELETEIRQW